MSDEQKTRKSNNGEGWYIMRDSTTTDDAYALSEGPFETLSIAEKEFKASAEHYDGQTVLIAKVQRRIKVKVETVKLVKFE